jgi:hypothetical protein
MLKKTVVRFFIKKILGQLFHTSTHNNNAIWVTKNSIAVSSPKNLTIWCDSSPRSSVSLVETMTNASRRQGKNSCKLQCTWKHCTQNFHSPGLPNLVYTQNLWMFGKVGLLVTPNINYRKYQSRFLNPGFCENWKHNPVECTFVALQTKASIGSYGQIRIFLLEQSAKKMARQGNHPRGCKPFLKFYTLPEV